MGEQIAFLEIQIDRHLDGRRQKQTLQQIITALDTHCPCWYLAVNHHANIEAFRDCYYAYLSAKTIIAMEPEHAVLFKLFRPDNFTITNETVRPRVHTMARVAAASTLIWKGPPKDFPAELLSETARKHLDRETSNALLNGRRTFELPIGFAGSWPCWN